MKEPPILAVGINVNKISLPWKAKGISQAMLDW